MAAFIAASTSAAAAAAVSAAGQLTGGWWSSCIEISANHMHVSDGVREWRVNLQSVHACMFTHYWRHVLQQQYPRWRKNVPVTGNCLYSTAHTRLWCQCLSLRPDSHLQSTELRCRAKVSRCIVVCALFVKRLKYRAYLTTRSAPKLTPTHFRYLFYWQHRFAFNRGINISLNEYAWFALLLSSCFCCLAFTLC